MVFTDTSDDISLILRQLLHRSSSSSSSSLHPTVTPSPSTFHSAAPHAGDNQHQYLPCYSSLPISTAHHQIPTLSTFLSAGRTDDDTLSDVVLTAPAHASYLPVSREANLSSDSLTCSAPMRSFENDQYGEDYDCESEEGADVGAEEAGLRMPASRNQSKRSRAAEVHNQSEKRRRSRINEKMKALQTLIPNSNKTDKASMLDEAIEYLKQLQLQVQMLSMRNGLSLHPLCVPGVSGILHPADLSQMGLDFTNKGRSVDELNMLPPRSHDVFDQAKQCLPSTSPSVMNSEPSSSYGIESCIRDHFGPSQLRNYPQVVCRDQNVPGEQLVPNNARTRPPENEIVTTRPQPSRGAKSAKKIRPTGDVSVEWS